MELLKNLYHFLIAAILISFAIDRVSVDAAGSVGINYGRIADDLPSPTQVVQLLKTHGVTKAKMYDTDSTVLTTFSGSEISLTVALPNDQLSAAAAANTSYTDNWIQSNILPYHPNTVMEAIAVGNEVFASTNNLTAFLVPAMENVYKSLVKYDVAAIS